MYVIRGNKQIYDKHGDTQTITMVRNLQKVLIIYHKYGVNGYVAFQNIYVHVRRRAGTWAGTYTQEGGGYGIIWNTVYKANFG